MDSDDTTAAPIRRWLGTVFALLVFAVAIAIVRGDLRGTDSTRVVPHASSHPDVQPGSSRYGLGYGYGDYRWTVWVAARNARTLATRPSALWQAEPCHPIEDALALGHPLITSGIVGIPAWWATRDPVATFNFVLHAQWLLAAFAMFLLVRDWTGSAPAGIAAGLLFAFQRDRLLSPQHFFILDLSWSVLALLFAHRLLVRGGYGRAIALATFGAAQIANNAYALLMTSIVALFAGGWLLVRHRLGALRLGPALLALTLVALASWGVLEPYVAMRESGAIGERSAGYLAWSALLPGERILGWLTLPLALAALLGPARRAVAPGLGDPRWALLATVVAAVWIATGGNAVALDHARWYDRAAPVALPNPYEALAGLLPMLDVVRHPSMLIGAGHLALCVLAGIGVARLVRAAPARWRAGSAAALLLVVGLEVLYPPLLGIPKPPIRYEPLEIAPPPSDVAFFEELEALGNTGPMLEIPVDRGPRFRLAQTDRVLLAAYHMRRTTACYNSYTPKLVREFDKLGSGLPAAHAHWVLLGNGIGTIVFTDPDVGFGSHAEDRRRQGRALRDSAASGTGSLELIHTDGRKTAYRVLDAEPAADAAEAEEPTAGETAGGDPAAEEDTD